MSHTRGDPSPAVTMSRPLPLTATPSSWPTPSGARFSLAAKGVLIAPSRLLRASGV